MNKFEHFACTQIFNSYPENMTFNDIKRLCFNNELREKYNDSLEDTEDEHHQIYLCEKYEIEWWDNIPGLLDDYARSAEIHFGDNK